MSIAQHSVACEDETRLAEVDESAAHEYTCDRVNLHWVIFRAAYRAARIPGLPRRACDLLAALARTVDRKNPNGRIFIGRARLVERARQSTRTLYRSLHDLEQAGLIMRGEQGRDIENQFDRAYLYLTDTAIRLLGYLDNLPVQSGQPRASAASATNAEVDPTSANSQKTELASPCATLADRIHEDLSPTAFQERHPAGQPPADLQRLRSLGFSDKLIFFLMRRAREHGKRLSDVVEATWQHLKQATWPRAYLTRLLARPVDFRRQAQLRTTETEARQVQEAEVVELDRILVEAAGKTYVDVSLTARFVVSDDARSLVAVRADEGIERTMPASGMHWFAREIRKGRVRLATAGELLTPGAPKARMSDEAKRPSLAAIVQTVAVSGYDRLHDSSKTGRACGVGIAAP